MFRVAVVAILAAVVTGCSGYSQQTAELLAASKAGNVDHALGSLEGKNASKDRDLLYYLEKGELLRQKGLYDDSRSVWLLADEKVRGWEDTAKSDPSKLLGDLGSVLVNDTTRRYDGRDYEKVFLNVRLALDHIALGDWDGARTEIKKMHEREAIIAEFRSKEINAAESAVARNGVKSRSFRQLNGYPIETLEDPAVRALKNSYESAFANYLAGFVYETLGEASLAAPGYRKAAEMRPNVSVIDDALSNLDARMSKAGKSDGVDTLIVVETGFAPGIDSLSLPIILPIPGKYGPTFIATPVSWPVIKPDPLAFAPASVTVDEQVVPATMLSDSNVMARRALSDEMPGIIARSTTRAISRGIAQLALDQSNERNTGNAQLIVSVISLVTKVASVATEVADERIWRTLPGTYSVARVSLSPGMHKASLMTSGGVREVEFQVGGKSAVVSMRVLGNNLYVSQSPVPVREPAADVAAQQTTEPVPPAQEAKPIVVTPPQTTEAAKGTPGKPEAKKRAAKKKAAGSKKSSSDGAKDKEDVLSPVVQEPKN